jgi:hypothetical protein
MRAIGLRARSIAYILGFLALAAARPAAAETLQLLWDPSPSPNVAGYIVYVRMPGAQTSTYDVGNATSFDLAGALDGQQYYFAVAAYAPGQLVGARSAEISRYPNQAPNQAPTLTNPGSQTTISGASAWLQLSGSDPEGGGLIFIATNLPPGLSAGSNGAISGTPNTPGAFVVTATVTDGQLTDTETFTWTIVAAAQPHDVTPPAVVISVPNAGNPSAPIVLNPAPGAPGNAANPVATGPAMPPDVVPAAPVGAAGQPAPAVTPNRFGRWRDAQRNPPAKAENTERSVLSRGPRPPAQAPAPAPRPNDTSTGTKLAARAKAAVQRASNPAATSAPVPTDAVTPLTVSATTQAARNTSWGRAKLTTTVTDQPFITLAGSATDERGISRVEWVTDRGLKGTATGTDTWIAAVPLLPGLNRVTVSVRDRAGNVTSSIVPVQYNERPTLKK